MSMTDNDLFGDFGDVDDFGGFDEETTSEASAEDDFDKKVAGDLKNMDSGAGQSEDSFMDERLREMNKKLPDWNLEPPFSFLK